MEPDYAGTSPHSRSRGVAPRTSLPRLLKGRSEDWTLEHVTGGGVADAVPLAGALGRICIFEPNAYPREVPQSLSKYVPHARLLLLSRLSLHCDVPSLFAEHQPVVGVGASLGCLPILADLRPPAVPACLAWICIAVDELVINTRQRPLQEIIRIAPSTEHGDEKADVHFVDEQAGYGLVSAVTNLSICFMLERNDRRTVRVQVPVEPTRHELLRPSRLAQNHHPRIMLV